MPPSCGENRRKSSIHVLWRGLHVIFTYFRKLLDFNTSITGFATARLQQPLFRTPILRSKILIQLEQLAPVCQRWFLAPLQSSTQVRASTPARFSAFGWVTGWPKELVLLRSWKLPKDEEAWGELTVLASEAPTKLSAMRSIASCQRLRNKRLRNEGAYCALLFEQPKSEALLTQYIAQYPKEERLRILSCRRA